VNFSQGPERHTELLRKIPTRDPQAAPNLIDLSHYYTAALTESSFGPAEDSLASLPTGVQTFNGTEFDVRGMIQLSTGRPMNQAFPAEVNRIKVDLRCRRLHFLQASCSAGLPRGTLVGHYAVHYADGSVLRVSLGYGLEIQGWWAGEVSTHVDTDNFRVAWRGTNPMAERYHNSIRLFHWTWDNPRPDTPIASLDFVSAMNGVAPFLIAITAEQRLGL